MLYALPPAEGSSSSRRSIETPAPFDPDAEVPERLARFGPAALDEGEVLQLVIGRCRLAGVAAADTADALMTRFGGLARIFGAPRADLARVVGAPLADELGLLHALLVRTLELPLRRREVLSSWTAVQTYLRAQMTALPREVFHVLFLDRKNQLIADERMGEGTVDHAPVYPREIVRRALELSACAILLAHNHPSGDPSPSAADVEMTKKIVDAARALGIVAHDHFIVAGDVVASLKALGLM